MMFGKVKTGIIGTGNIGTDLLRGAEQVAKKLGLVEINSITTNIASEKSCKNAGWEFVRELKNGTKEYRKRIEE